ncbi:MAG TPA: ATP-binding protein [Candidatus Kapabacteria bacterium]|nr:ATP-binding protein [Candidatus Kapabacteria bacterium]
MQAQKTTWDTVLESLWIPSKEYFRSNRLFRRIFYLLVILIIAAKFLMLAANSIVPSVSQHGEQLHQRGTKETQRKIHNIHSISGTILDSIASDERLGFYTQFTSHVSTALFLRPYANAWVELYNRRNIIPEPDIRSNIAIAIFDNASHLRGWYSDDISSPGLDTTFASSPLLDRRSRLSEIDSNALHLYYVTARKLFSRQGSFIGYVLIKFRIADRKAGEHISLQQWVFDPARLGETPSEFIVSTQPTVQSPVFLDSVDRNAQIGFLDSRQFDEIAARPSAFNKAMSVIDGLLEILVIGLLTLIIEQAFAKFAETRLKQAVSVWLGLVGGLLILRLMIYWSGGVSDFLLQMELFTPAAIPVATIPFFDSSAEMFISAAFYLYAIYGVYRIISYVFLPNSKIISRPQAAILFVSISLLITLLLCCYAFIEAEVIPLTLVTVGEHVGKVANPMGVWIAFVIFGGGVFMLIFILQKILCRAIKRTTIIPPLQKFVYFLGCVSQIGAVLFVASIAEYGPTPEMIFVCVLIIAQWIVWNEGKKNFETIRFVFHPALVAILLGASLSFVTAFHIITDSGEQANILKIQPSDGIHDGKETISNYIKKTTDSTVHSIDDYNNNSYLFWKSFFTSYPHTKIQFVVYDSATDKELFQVSTADAVPSLVSHRQIDSASNRIVGGSIYAVNSQADSLTTAKLTSLFGLQKPSISYILGIYRFPGSIVLPSDRISDILWSKPEEEASMTGNEGYLHIAMKLTTLCIVLVFIGFMWSFVLRLIASQSFFFVVTLQEKFLLVVFLAVGGAYNIIFAVSETVLRTDTASASEEIFVKNNRVARNEIASSIRFDSVSIVRRHITSAAAALNCDIAIYNSDYTILTSSCLECTRFGLLPTTLPSLIYRHPIGDEHAGFGLRSELSGIPIRYSVEEIPSSKPNTRPVECLVIQKEEPYRELLKRFTDNISDALGALAFLSLLLASYFSTRIVNPLNRLKRATGEVAAGRLAISLPKRRSDEIGEVIQSFNQMTHELSSSREQVAQIEREGAWKEMARQVAHEIKNPLTPIKLSIQHVQHAFEHQDTNFPNIFRRVLKTITEQIDVLTRIATEFARFGEMPRRRYSFVTLRPVVENAITLFEAERSHIRFAVNIPLNLSKIYADEEEFRRALVNLIKNAIQAIFGWGIILISAEERSGLIYIRITDSGVGMKPETVTKAFDPNFSTKTSGMGLGLAIVKKTITDMSGTIRVESEPGKGTTFFIELPARDPSSIQG